MNLRFLIQNNLLQALGWSLIDSLWQMGTLWLLYLLVTGRGQRFTARIRHNLALLAGATGTLLFLISFVYRLLSESHASGLFSGLSTALTGFLPAMQALIQPALPMLSSLYLFTLALLLIRFSRQYYYTTQLLRKPGRKAPAELRVYLEQTALRLGIKRNVSLWITDRVSSPFTLGFWKPVILLPLASLNRLSVAQTEAIILHELEHINGNDYLINLLLTLNDLLFFFNPFALQLSKAVIRERENHCDDTVLHFRYAPADYAEALLILEQERTTPLLAPAANGNGKKILLHRMERILLGKPQPRYSLRGSLLLSCFLLLALVSTVSPALLSEKPALFSGLLTPAAEKSAQPVAAVRRNKPEPQPKTLKPTTIDPATALVADSDPLAFTDNNYIERPVPQPEAISVMGAPIRNYSIDETESVKLTDEPAENGFTFEPYIPANSFRYQLQNDTLPDAADLDKTLKAIDELKQALKTIDGLNLKPLEEKLKSVELSKINSEALKAEIRKAITQQYESELQQMQSQLALNQLYYKQLESNRKKQLELKQEKARQQQQVIEYRLQEGKRVKKVVVI